MEDVYTIALAGLRLIKAEQMYFGRRTSVVCMAVWRCCPIIRNINLCLHRYVCAVLQLMLHQLQQCFEYVDVNVFPCTFDLSNYLAAIVIPLQQHDLSFALLRQWRDDSTTWN